jgi:hypothetical protein
MCVTDVEFDGSLQIHYQRSSGNSGGSELGSPAWHDWAGPGPGPYRGVHVAAAPNAGMSDIVSRRVLSLVAVLAVGVVGSGLARYTLGTLGYEALGSAVYVVGYATMVVVVWYGWIRPLDITGPAGADDG